MTISTIPAATVILARPGLAGLEVFLVRRHRKASFMSGAFVFPGGKVDDTDGSLEVAAARELFEEAGVLLADRSLAADVQSAWRRKLLAGQATFPELLAAEKLSVDRSRLHVWARWVTPSFEPRRFDATFFLAELPPDQVPSFDAQETVDELWISPADALARQAEGSLRLPPPQIRTFHELAAAGTLGAAIAASPERGRQLAPICPRRLPGDQSLTMVLPWDPEYTLASGEGEAVPPGHVLAVPPTRMTWNGTAWVVGPAGP